MKKLYSILFKNDDLGNRARDLYFRTNDNLAVTYFNENNYTRNYNSVF